MTTLLQQAIETLRQLPEEQQDLAADFLFAYLASDEREFQRPSSSRASKPKPLIGNPSQLPLPRRPGSRQWTAGE